jgi:ribonuclease VapC
MVIDASALLAILLDEPARARIEAAIAADTLRLVSSVSKLSAALKLTERHGPDAPARLDRLLSEINASVVPFDEPQADMAASAFARYGLGQHAAALDWSACAAYALAVSEAEPLLFAGGGLAQTNVEGVIGKKALTP